jgi:hypothetical protein
MVKAQAQALRVLAERVEHGAPELVEIAFTSRRH